MSDRAIPEPGCVTLPPEVVESLRKRLVRCMDQDLTDHQRNDERIMLVGALGFYLNGPVT